MLREHVEAKSQRPRHAFLDTLLQCSTRHAVGRAQRLAGVVSGIGKVERAGRNGRLHPCGAARRQCAAEQCASGIRAPEAPAQRRAAAEKSSGHVGCICLEVRSRGKRQRRRAANHYALAELHKQVQRRSVGAGAAAAALSMSALGGSAYPRPLVPRTSRARACACCAPAHVAVCAQAIDVAVAVVGLDANNIWRYAVSRRARRVGRHVLQAAGGSRARPGRARRDVRKTRGAEHGKVCEAEAASRLRTASRHPRMLRAAPRRRGWHVSGTGVLC